MDIETITIAGIELNGEDFPILYKWAQTHPDTLETRLKGLSKATENDDMRSVAVIFEMDLAHERAL